MGLEITPSLCSQENSIVIKTICFSKCTLFKIYDVVLYTSILSDRSSMGNLICQFFENIQFFAKTINN